MFWRRSILCVLFVLFCCVLASEQVTAATLDHFDVTVVSNVVTAGQNFTLTVTARDNLNAVMNSYTETPTLNLSSGTASPDSIFFTVVDNGIHTEAVSITTSGTIILTVVDSTSSDSFGTVTLRVAPSMPVLLTPVYGTDTNQPKPAFTWSGVPGADSYEIQIDNNMDFSSPEVDSNSLTNAYTPGSSLIEAVYYWRVRAYEQDNGFYGIYSESFTLTVDTTAPPRVTGVGSRAFDTYVQLNWTETIATDTVGYFVFRSVFGSKIYTRLNTGPLKINTFNDTTVVSGDSYQWVIRLEDLATNLSDTSDTIGAPRISATKTVDTTTMGGAPDTTRPGATIRFKITIRNIGYSPADTAQITDYISRFTTYAPASITQDTGLGDISLTDAKDADAADFNITHSNSVTLNIEHINVNDTAIIKFKVTID